MRKYLLTFIVLFLFQNLALAQSERVWASKDGNMINASAKAIFIDNGVLFLATEKALYKSADSKGKWQSVFSVSSKDSEITCVKGAAGIVLTGTRHGLFRSTDTGVTWQNIFRMTGKDRNCVNCVEFWGQDKKKVLIGTEKGLFLSEDSGGNWREYSGNLRGSVRSLGVCGQTVYAGSDSGLYRKDASSAGWERLLVSYSPEKGPWEEADQGPEEIEKTGSASVNCIATDGAKIYIGSGNRILWTDDGASPSWNAFPIEGLSGKISSILPSKRPSVIYCSSSKGVFEYSPGNKRWVELYKGKDKSLGADNIVFDDEAESHLWAIGEGGVYRLETLEYSQERYMDVERGMKTLEIISDNEPTFRELQKAALTFAELGPEKIKKWRQEARMRALLPKVSFGLDTNRSTTYEIYTSATKDYAITGPDDISNGWDVSLSWELGDIIWSDDQTNIDVRSRLTTELRNDVLDDLRRAYYERKRLQFELVMDPPKDHKIKFEKEMRVEELGQAIDDLTGNYLSEHTRK